MERKDVQVKATVKATEQEIKRLAYKIFRGEPLSVEEALLLTNEEVIYAVSSKVWDMCISSI
uniref:Uncharacterized protein n=1 Tax=Thermocrinis ruber TaxID=75906 RepID=A0A7C5SXL4_9AQUI